MLEYNLDAIKLKIVKLDASEDDYIGFDWFRDDKYFDEIWAKYVFKPLLHEIFPPVLNKAIEN